MPLGRKYRSEIDLGERYRDTATGFEGTAVAVTFWQHGCERVTLKGINKNGEVVDYAFDAPEVESVKSGEAVKLIERKTGGPHDRVGAMRR
jgi:hypothetical protein